tara:strand:+ start:888 stop:1385 length:498 start_codon:yes stop_codon:yes gene_type:complete
MNVYMRNMVTTSRPVSPVNEGEDSVADVLLNGRSKTTLQVDELLRFVKHLDSGAEVQGLNKTHDSTLIRIALSSQISGTGVMALKTSVAIAYPFCSTSIIESAVDGNAKLHVLFHAEREEYKQACSVVSKYRLVRLVGAMSNFALFSSLVSFSCLFYAHAISHAT